MTARVINMEEGRKALCHPPADEQGAIDAKVETGLQKILAAHPLDSDCPDTLILQAERRAAAIIAYEDDNEGAGRR